MSEFTDIKKKFEEMERAEWGRLWQGLEHCSRIFDEFDPFERVQFERWLKLELYNKQKGRCANPACGKKLSIFEMQIDHIIPYKYGGGHERTNLQLLCAPCNQSKGSDVHDPVALLEYLEDRYRNYMARRPRS